jgi:hypothetical protein
MRIKYWLITYNGMGGHELSSYGCAFLLQGAPRTFGSAVKSFEPYGHVTTRSRARPTLGEMKKRFRAHLETLPRVQFLRKYARFDISYVSRLGDEEDVKRKRDTAESLKLFRATCDEIASVLQLARERLKKADDFDWMAFVAQLNRQLGKIPRTARAFTALLKTLRDATAQHRKEPVGGPKPSARLLRNKPRMIAIDHDDYYASHVGHTSSGAQFFLTRPFVPALAGDAGREFVALYIFDSRGRFREARIDDLGLRSRLDAKRVQSTFERRFAELGRVKFGRILVQPFQIKRFNTVFGLIPEPLEDEADNWCVTVQPGNYMAFFKPWDSGDYDT